MEDRRGERDVRQRGAGGQHAQELAPVGLRGNRVGHVTLLQTAGLTVSCRRAGTYVRNRRHDRATGAGHAEMTFMWCFRRSDGRHGAASDLLHGPTRLGRPRHRLGRGAVPGASEASPRQLLVQQHGGVRRLPGPASTSASGTKQVRACWSRPHAHRLGCGGRAIIATLENDQRDGRAVFPKPLRFCMRGLAVIEPRA